MNSANSDVLINQNLGRMASADEEELSARERSLLEAAGRLKMLPAELDVFLRAGLQEGDVPLNLEWRRTMLGYLRRHAEAPPRWLQLSGLWPELERAESGLERRRKIRALHAETVRLIVRALKEHDSDPDKGERSIFWDPVIEICRELEISQSKLSGLCRELTGNSLKQTVDCVRAKGLREKMKAGLRKELGASFGTEMEVSRKGAEAQRTAKNGGEKGGDRWEVWGRLKAGRKWPEFSQNGWANGFGYCSYRRMYRACQVVFGKTPHQMEMELIEEILGEEMAGEEGEERVEGIDGDVDNGEREGVAEHAPKEPRT